MPMREKIKRLKIPTHIEEIKAVLHGARERLSRMHRPNSHKIFVPGSGWIERPPKKERE